MEFKIGQKYMIVDIDAWFNNKVYKVGTLNVFGYLSNGDIVQVREDEIDFTIDMKGQECQTEFINQLIKNPLWYDSCIELITDDIADVSKMGDEMVLMKPIVLKTHPKAIIPTKRQADAGFDLYGIFNDKIVIQKENEMMIFHTGLKIRFDTGYVSTIKERGSTRLHNLNVGAGVVEGNYTGEYLIMMTNLNDYLAIVYADGDITSEELASAMRKSYSAGGSCDIKYTFKKDEFGRLCAYELIDNVFEEPYEQLSAYIYPQSKAIAQMVITKKEDWEFDEVDEDTFNSIDTDRGEGRFGSSLK